MNNENDPIGPQPDPCQPSEQPNFADFDSYRNLETADLVLEIKISHRRAKGYGRLFVEECRECGAMLTEAKARVGHCNWLDWLAENFTEAKHDTASNYMRLHARWEFIPVSILNRDDVSMAKLLAYLKSKKALSWHEKLTRSLQDKVPEYTKDKSERELEPLNAAFSAIMEKVHKRELSPILHILDETKRGEGVSLKNPSAYQREFLRTLRKVPEWAWKKLPPQYIRLVRDDDEDDYRFTALDLIDGNDALEYMTRLHGLLRKAGSHVETERRAAIRGIKAWNEAHRVRRHTWKAHRDLFLA